MAIIAGNEARFLGDDTPAPPRLPQRMTPWLSVVVPVHDGARWLGPTLASVATGRPEGIELLLYNSGDDGGAARAVAKGFAGVIDLTWQDTPLIKSWTAKINRGVAQAKAAHVVMLHQDDLWLPGHVAAIHAAIAAAPRADMSIAPSRFVGPEGQMLGHWHLPFAPGLHSAGRLAPTLLVQNSIAIPSPVIRREAWLACGGLDEALWYTPDWDLYLKLAQRAPVYVRPEVTTAFRVHGSSLTMTGSRDIAAFRQQLERVLDRHRATVSPLPAGIEARARAAIAVNCALALASAGKLGALPGAGLALARLGPLGLNRFLHESRLVDRLLPRLWLSLSGAMRQ